MIRQFGKLWRPEVFQDARKKNIYFEGWFFKIVDASSNNTFAFIPGIFIGEPDDSHAFVMALDAETHVSTYHVYPVDDFFGSNKVLDIRVGDHHFRSDFFEIHIDSDERSVHGRIELGKLHAWPVKFLSPGVMGWYAFVPFMQCYHGVISFDHAIGGELNINGRSVNFDGGRGYIEKDWGRSFPSAYLWMQSNHFDTPGVSLMASVANIPWLKSSFRGFIVGLWMNGTLLRFTTYTGAQLERCEINEHDIVLVVSDKRYKLDIQAERSESAVLHAPYNVNMTPKVSETLGSTIKLSLYDKREQTVVFSETGTHAGLDVNGKLEEIIS